MNETLEAILLNYHADDMRKKTAMEAIQDLIDAERITLRDEFAMRAMAGLVSKNGRVYTQEEIENRCNDAYRYSDAMLEARKS